MIEYSELVLNLEQSALQDLQARPLPKQSPSKCEGMKPGLSKKKSNRPPARASSTDGAGRDDGASRGDRVIAMGLESIPLPPVRLRDTPAGTACSSST